MAKQLYLVTQTVQSLVLAESETDALMESIDDDPQIEDASPATYLPSGYDDDTLVWGPEEDLTVKAAIQAGYAPGLVTIGMLMKLFQDNDLEQLLRLLSVVKPNLVDGFLATLPSTLSVETGERILSLTSKDRESLYNWQVVFQNVWDRCHPFQRSILLEPLR